MKNQSCLDIDLNDFGFSFPCEKYKGEMKPWVLSENVSKVVESKKNLEEKNLYKEYENYHFKQFSKETNLNKNKKRKKII